MKKLCILLLLLVSSIYSFSCPFCNKKISDGIYDSMFYPNLFTMLSAFIVIAIIVVALTLMGTRKHKARLAINPRAIILNPVPLTTASIVMGIGVGGFIDGIVFHQILQWHEMLSNKIPATDYTGKSINMFWDGIFHAFCLFVVLTGVILLWKTSRRKDADVSGKLLSGGLITGWGIFNIVEGIIDHQLLKLHNVMEYSNDHDIANYTFLATSVVMLVIGSFLIKSINRSNKNYSG